jgi:hypothetical protein
MPSRRPRPRSLSVCGGVHDQRHRLEEAVSAKRFVDVGQVFEQMGFELPLGFDEPLRLILERGRTVLVEGSDEAHVVAVVVFALLEHGSNLALEPPA